MNITIEELFSAQEAFGKLARNESIAPAIKLRLLPITRSFDQHVKDANEVRLGLFKKYGTPTETGNDFTMEGSTPENLKALQSDWRETLSSLLIIPGKRLRFENISGVSLSTADLMNLDWLIEFPAEVEDEAPESAAAAKA